MSVYIITNRRIKDGRIVVDGKEKAGHDFRIAKCDPESGTYELLPDYKGDDYEAVAKNKKVKLRGSQKMFEDFYTDMSGDNGGDILFFIHGFMYNFNANLRHIKKIHRLYVKGNIKHLVYLSWPSRSAPLYWDDQRDARETGRILGRLGDKLSQFFTQMFEHNQRQPCGHKIHLAAHSLGNQVFYYMMNEMLPEEAFPMFSEVLLLNADVRWDCFEPGKGFSRLLEYCERVHIYTHRSDDALRVSRFTKNFKRRLGFKGPKRDISLAPETFVVDTTTAASNRAAADLIEMGAVEQEPESVSLKERIIDHWGYLWRLQVQKDIRLVLAGTEEDEISIRKKKPGSQVRYILK